MVEVSVAAGPREHGGHLSPGELRGFPGLGSLRDIQVIAGCLQRGCGVASGLRALTQLAGPFAQVVAGAALRQTSLAWTLAAVPADRVSTLPAWRSERRLRVLAQVLLNELAQPAGPGRRKSGVPVTPSGA